MIDPTKHAPLIVSTNIGVFFDTETTGIPDWKIPSGDPKQPHLTQIAAIVVDLNTRETINSIDLIVQPNGWEIPQECADLNGITTQYAKAHGMPEEMVVGLFLALWSGHKRFAYNTTFDNRIIRIATKRYFEAAAQDLWKAGPYECQMMAARKFLGGKNPKLHVALKEICGTDLVGAHTAMADTIACKDIYFALQDKNAEAGDMFK